MFILNLLLSNVSVPGCGIPWMQLHLNNWNTAVSVMYQQCFKREEWVFQQDNRHRFSNEKGTFKSSNVSQTFKISNVLYLLSSTNSVMFCKKHCWRTTVSCKVCDNLIPSSAVFRMRFYFLNITKSKIWTLVGNRSLRTIVAAWKSVLSFGTDAHA